MRRRALAAAVGIGTTAAALIALIAFSRGANEVGRPDDIPFAGQVAVDGSKPCGGGGGEVSLSDASRVVPLMVPDHARANAANIVDVRRCGADSASILFDSGIKVTIGHSDMKDPAAFFASRVAEYPIQYSVGTVKGFVAGFYDPDAAGGQREKAGIVWFVRSGWDIMVEGAGNASLAELREIAESGA